MGHYSIQPTYKKVTVMYSGLPITAQLQPIVVAGAKLAYWSTYQIHSCLHDQVIFAKDWRDNNGTRLVVWREPVLGQPRPDRPLLLLLQTRQAQNADAQSLPQGQCPTLKSEPAPGQNFWRPGQGIGFSTLQL